MYEKSKMRTMQLEMGRFDNGKRRRLCMSVLQKEAFKVIWATIATAIIGAELIKYTMDKRGYFAVGGEWIMMILVFYATYRFLGKKKKAAHKK